MISLHQICLLSSFLSSFVLSFINKVCNITNRDIFIRFAHRRSYFVRYPISSFDFVIFRRRGGSRCEYTGFFFLMQEKCEGFRTVLCLRGQPGSIFLRKTRVKMDMWDGLPSQQWLHASLLYLLAGLRWLGDQSWQGWIPNHTTPNRVQCNDIHLLLKSLDLGLILVNGPRVARSFHPPCERYIPSWYQTWYRIIYRIAKLALHSCQCKARTRNVLRRMNNFGHKLIAIMSRRFHGINRPGPMRTASVLVLPV